MYVYVFFKISLRMYKKSNQTLPNQLQLVSLCFIRSYTCSTAVDHPGKALSEDPSHMQIPVLSPSPHLPRPPVGTICFVRVSCNQFAHIIKFHHLLLRQRCRRRWIFRSCCGVRVLRGERLSGRIAMKKVLHTSSLHVSSLFSGTGATFWVFQEVSVFTHFQISRSRSVDFFGLTPSWTYQLPHSESRSLSFGKMPLLCFVQCPTDG